MNKTPLARAWKSTPVNRRLSPLWMSLGLFVASMLCAVRSHAQSVWNTGTGNWSSGASWLPAAAPVSGSTTSLVFGGSSSYTATDDISGTFLLNQLQFLNSVGTTTLAGNAISFVNATTGTLALPTLQMSGAGSATLSNAITWSGETTVTNSGSGALLFSGSQTYNNGTKQTIINSGTGSITLADAITYANTGGTSGGGLVLNLNNNSSGTFNVGNLGALGSATNVFYLNVGGTGTVRFSGSTSGDLFGNTMLLTVLNGATFDFNGNGETMGAIAGSGTIAMTAGAGITVTMASYYTFSGKLTGSGGLTLGSNTQTLALTGSTSDYTGATTITGGTLIVSANAPNGSAGALGNSTSSVLVGNTSGSSPASLMMDTPGVTIGRNILLQSGNTGSAIVGGINSSGTVNYTGNITLGTAASAAKGLTLSSMSGGTVLITGNLLRATGATGATDTLTVIGGGTVDLMGNNTFTGATTISGGTLVLDDSVFNGGKLSSSAALTLNGGSLTLVGNSAAASTQVVSGTILGNSTSPLGGGAEVMVESGTNTNVTLNLGAITRNTGATVDFNPLGNGTGVARIITITANGTNGILGAYATYQLNDWAVNDGTGNIIALAAGSYTTTFGSGKATSLSASTTLASGGATTNTLRFTSAAALTFNSTTPGTLTLESGGILVASTAANTSIGTTTTRGTLTSSTGELIINQQSTLAALTINSVISGTYLTISGPGTVNLTGTNTYTGSTIINNGSTLTVTATNNLGAATTGIYLNGGTLSIPSGTATFDPTSGHDITIGAGGGTLNFVTVQSITGGALSGSGNLYLTGGGGFTIGTSASTFNGSIYINSGGIYENSSQLTSVASVIVANGGTWGVEDDATAAFNIATGGRIVLNGTGAGGNGALRLTDQTTGTSLLDPRTTINNDIMLQSDSLIEVDNGSHTGVVSVAGSLSVLTLAGNISGPGALSKAGLGNLVLSGANNTYTGATNVQAGILILGLGNDRLPTSTTVTLGSGTSAGILELGGFTQTVAGLAASGTATGDSVIGGSSATTSLLTINAASGSQTINAILGGTGIYNTGANNNLGFIKSGAGTATLTGANTYTGGTTVAQGTLTLGSAGALGNTGATLASSTPGTIVSAGATLDLNGQNVQGQFTLNGQGLNNAGALVNNSGTAASIGTGIASLRVSSATTTGWSAGASITLGAPSSGTPATAVAQLGLSSSSFNVTAGGSGFGLAPVVTVAGGGGSGAVVIGSVGVTSASYTITSGTTTYSVAPTVTLSNGATATAVLNGSGLVTGITITNPGSNFSATPSITFSGGTVLSSGTNPTGTGNATHFTVVGLTVVTPGTGYTSLPSVSITGGTGATATAVDGNFVLNGFAITSSGSGYTSTPSVNITGGTASATANLSSVSLASDSAIGGSGSLTVNAGISGSYGLTKVGAGTTTLTGVNTYTGATNVNAGTLALTSSAGGTLGNTAITIGSGGTLAPAAGYVAGNTSTAGAGATLVLNPGGMLNLADGTIGSFTLVQNSSFAGNAATFAGGQLAFDLGTAALSSDSIVVALNGVAGAGLATSSGANGIAINPTGSIATGTYTLINAGGTLNASNFYLASPNLNVGGTLYNLSLGLSGTNLQLTISTGGAAVTPSTAYWTGALGSSWNSQPGGTGTATNWSSSASGTTDTFALPSSTTNVFMAATSGGNLNTSLNQSFTVNSLTYTGTGSTISSGTGSNTLTIQAAALSGNTVGSGITVNAGSGANTISAGVVLGASQTWTNNATNPLTVSGAVSDGGHAYSLSTAGTGTIILSGASSFSGGVTIGAGSTLQVQGTETGSTGPLGSGGLIYFSGGTLQFSSTNSYDYSARFAANQAITIDTNGTNVNFASALGGTDSLVKNGLGTLILYGNNSYSGITTVNGGTLFIAGSSTLSGGLASYGSSVLNIYAPVTLGASQTWTNSSTNFFTVNGALSDGGMNYALNLTGGGTFIFSGASTFGGGVTIGSGTTLQVQGSDTGSAGPLGNGGLIYFSGGILQYSSTNSYDYSGRFAANQAIQIDTNNTSVTLATALAGTDSLTKYGEGTLTLSGLGSYSGLTTINNGTLNITGASTLAGGFTLSNDAAVSISNTLTLGASQTWTNNSSGTLTVSGNVTDAAQGYNLTTTGTGTIVLGGTNTINGNLTVSSGTLDMTGSYTGLTASSVLTNGVGAVTSVINVSGNMTLDSYYGGVTAGAVSVYNQTAGTVTAGGPDTNTNNSVSVAGYGYFNVTGGTFSEPTGRFNVNDGAGTGVVYVGGSGTINATGTYVLIGYNGTNAAGSVTIGPGGTFNHSGATQPIYIDYTTTGAYGIVNLAGGTLITTTKALTFGGTSAASGQTAFINLAAGTFSTGVGISSINTSGSGSSYYFSAAGGTISTTAAISSLIPSTYTYGTITSTIFGAIDNSAVTGDTSQNFTGGLTINTNKFNSTISAPLLGATGVGVTQANIVIPGTGNSGYVGAPLVEFSGGTLMPNGTPASGYAIISGGQVTGIVITNPGTYGAGSTPTITLVGGGGSISPFPLQPLNTSNTAGNLTVTGGGLLTFSGNETGLTGSIILNGAYIGIGANGLLNASQVSGLVGRSLVMAAGGGIVYDTTGALQQISEMVNGSSSGTIALTTSKDVNLSALGVNLPTAFLGAASGSTVTYTSSYTPGTSGVYRLGGGGGTLIYSNAIVDASSTSRSSVIIGSGAGSGTVVMTGTNTFTGGLTLSSGNTLQIASSNVTANFGSSPAGLVSTGGIIQWASGATVDITSGAGAISGGITLSSTTSFDTNGNNVTLSGQLGNGGAGGLTKIGSGTLILSGTGTFTGASTVSAGTLDLASTLALAKSTLTATASVTFDASNTSTTWPNIANTFFVGGLTGSTNMVLQNTNSTAITLGVGLNGTAQTYTGVLSGPGSLEKLGSGTFTISTNAQTYAGSTYIINGNSTSGNTPSTIALTFGTASPTLTNILPTTSALIFGGTAAPSSPTTAQVATASVNGGRLTLTGAAATNSQTFASTTIGLGNAAVTLTSSGTNLLALNLGAITRSAGGVLYVTNPSNTLGSTNGVLTSSGTASTLLKDANGVAYAVVGNTDWAFKDSTNTWIVAGTYTTASNAATFSGDADITASFSATSGSTVNSIRLNNSTARTLTLAGTNTVTTGGILFGSSAATASTITGGTIQPGSTGNQLVIINDSTTSVLTSILANNGSTAASVTYSGNATIGSGKNDIKIGVANTYTGDTYISGTRVQINSAGTSPFGTTGNVYIYGNADGQFDLNQSSTVTNNFYIIGNGWAETSGPFGALRVDSGTLAGTITLMGDAGIGTNATGTGTISANISNLGNVAYNLTKLGTYTLTLSGTNTSFNGQYIVSAGALQFSSSNAFGGATGISIANVGDVIANYSGGATAIAAKILSGSAGTLAITSLSASDNIDLSGANNAGTFLGALGTVTYAGTLTPNTIGGVSTYRLGGGSGTLTYAGNITGTSAVVIGGGSTAGTTVGTVILTGTNSYRGGTSFVPATNAPTLQIANTANPFSVLGSGPVTFTGSGTIQFASSFTVANADITSASNITSINLNGGTAVFDTQGNGTTATPVVFANGFGNYGAGAFQKNGSSGSALQLNKTSTFLGNQTVNGGTLLINTANPFNFGFTSTGVATATTTTISNVAGAILQLQANTTLGMLASTNSTTTSASAGVINLNGKTLTLAGSASGTVSAVINGGVGASGSGALIKTGSGTLTLQNTNTWTGSTTINGGGLTLDFSALTATPTSIISSSSALSLGGGTLKVIDKTSGTVAQSFNGTTITGGTNLVTTSGTTPVSITINLGALSRTGGTMDLTVTGLGTGAITTTTANTASTILGGWATVNGGADWAVSAGNGSTAGAITAISSYGGSYATGGDVDNGAINSIGGAASTINSLRFNSASAVTLDATGGLSISSGGILMTPTVAANAVVIANGTLTSGNGTDLIINQFDSNASGTLTISSQITGNIGLTKSGTGGVILTNGSNNFVGGVSIGGSSYLQVNATGALGSSSNAVSLNSAGGLYINAGVMVANNITINNASGISAQGALWATGTGTATLSGSITVNQSASAGGIFGAASGATLVVSGPVTAASGQTVSVRAGAVTFSGSGSSYDYFSNSGAVSLGATNALSTTALVDMGGNASATLDLNGNNQTIGGLTKLVTTNSATVTNSSTTLSTLTLNVAASDGGIHTGSYTYSGAITGNLALVKNGSGSETLTGTNTYTGGTTINAGTLYLGGISSLGVGSNPNGTDATVTLNGGTLDLNGNANIAVGLFSGSGGTMTDSGNTPGTAVFSVASSTSSSFAGSINDGIARTLAFKKDGAGTLTLSGASTYSGMTEIFGGALDVQNASALGSTSKTAPDIVYSGAALQLDSGVTVASQSLTLNGTGVSNAGALRSVAGTNAWNGSVSLASSSRINSDAGSTLTLGGGVSGSNVNLNVGGAGKTVISSAVALGSGNITADGSGTVVLAGADTSTGTTTVQSGSLQVGAGGTGQTGTGAVTVQSGATILGTGYVQGGSFTAASGSTVQVGDSTAATSYGTLHFTPSSGAGSVTFQAGSTIVLGINPGGTSDLLQVTGNGSTTLSFSGGLTITAPTGFTPTATATFHLLDWSGLASAPTFSSSFSSSSLLYGNGDTPAGLILPDIIGSGFAWDLSAFTTAGNLSIVTAGVPEPSRMLLLGVGLLLLGIRRRRL